MSMERPINKIIESMYEDNIRAEVIIHVPTMLAHDSFPDAAREAFMEDDPDTVWEAIGIEPPYDLDDEGLIFEHLMDEGKTGFLIRFATPVPTDIEADHHSLSWGFYSMHWIYSETYQEACEKALEWREQFIERKRKEALAGVA